MSRYYDEENLDIDELMSELASYIKFDAASGDFFNYVEAFKDYCDEIATEENVFVTKTDKTIAITWKTGAKHEEICILNPEKFEVTLIPSKDSKILRKKLKGKDQITLTLDEEFIDILKPLTKNWRDEQGNKFTFTWPKKKKASPSKFELSTYQVKNNGKKPLEPKNLMIVTKGVHWGITFEDNQVKTMITTQASSKVRATLSFKDKETTQAIGCLLILSRAKDDPNYTSEHTEELEGYEATVYNYEKNRQGLEAESFTCSFYDPVNNCNSFLNAVKKGKYDFVEACLEKGADPMQKIYFRKYDSTQPLIEAAQADDAKMLTLLLKYPHSVYTSLGSDLKKISTLSYIALETTESKVKMLLDCGYDCTKDIKSILYYYRKYLISDELRDRIITAIKPFITRHSFFNKDENLKWDIEIYDDVAYATGWQIDNENFNIFNTTVFEDPNVESLINRKKNAGYIEV